MQAEVDDDVEETSENGLEDNADEIDDVGHDTAEQEEGLNSEEDESVAKIDPPSPVSARKKVLKRIVKAFSDDSDDDDNNQHIYKKRTDLNGKKYELCEQQCLIRIVFRLRHFSA